MKWWKKLKSLLRRNKSNLQSENRNSHQDDLIEKEIYFPCNAFFRKIIEAVLEQKGISYRDMRLFVIDAEDGAYLRQEEEQYLSLIHIYRKRGRRSGRSYLKDSAGKCRRTSFLKRSSTGRCCITA